MIEAMFIDGDKSVRRRWGQCEVQIHLYTDKSRHRLFSLYALKFPCYMCTHIRTMVDGIRLGACGHSILTSSWTWTRWIPQHWIPDATGCLSKALTSPFWIYYGKSVTV
ncbi:hypothetical protein NC652_032607 [Populus alba x Populus x berolinensis]|uniref:Uncharacterized protein n=1 Tax=Populus alba x Populus x berolinensis TaxID=444605 RepID=A0AAD6LS04_9ROSI|nr:hypothetical protein NC652_032607 [Populus alba x Populus x berolinensis]KAJ6972025.1 hypothetical protein NC653_032557 [Populus alba x Populus x berolinensis]